MANDCGASKALATAIAFLSGQIGAIEACWPLSSFAYDHECPLSQADRNLFIAIQSETDHLPVGTLRDHRHPDFSANQIGATSRVRSGGFGQGTRCMPAPNRRYGDEGD